MLELIFNVRGYLFWLLALSAACALAEAVVPWRKQQRQWREGLTQDGFWLLFNGHFFSILAAPLFAASAAALLSRVPALASWQLLANLPTLPQFLILFVVRDFVEWCIHNLLHRTPALWELHKLHHSISTMDWIGNFRFHWMEIVVYRSLSFVPIVAMGADPNTLLLVGIVSTLIGHLNHSNLNITWGPFRYLLNSPRMHIWHHMAELPADRPAGVNFGTGLSAWDWLFGTAYWPSRHDCPAQQPDRLGFRGMDRFPLWLIPRFVLPPFQALAVAFGLRRSKALHRRS